MVAISPRSKMGSRSKVEKENVSLLVSLRFETKLSIFLKPKARLSCSILYEQRDGELENGLSKVGTGGGV